MGAGKEQAVHYRSRSLPGLAAALDTARQQQKATIIDLCGEELYGEVSQDIVVPGECTLRNGSIHLPNAKVCFESNATLDNICITGPCGGDQADCAVEVSGCLHMQACIVVGAWWNAAVAVRGGKLVAVSSSMHSSEGRGLLLEGGGHASLERCKVDENAKEGCVVSGRGSELSAQDSSASRNGDDNVYIRSGSTGHFVRCAMDSSSRGYGLNVCNQGSSAAAKATSMTSNTGHNVRAHGGASVKLNGCKCDNGRGHGWCADAGGTITADAACTVVGNAWGSTNEGEGGRIVQARPSCCCVS